VVSFTHTGCSNLGERTPGPFRQLVSGRSVITLTELTRVLCIYRVAICLFAAPIFGFQCTPLMDIAVLELAMLCA